MFCLIEVRSISTHAQFCILIIYVFHCLVGIGLFISLDSRLFVYQFFIHAYLYRSLVVFFLSSSLYVPLP